MLTREDLVDLLRTPERWPESFKWNYNHPEQCALGLMSYYGLRNKKDICKALKLDNEDFERVFFKGTLNKQQGVDREQVTPQEVAEMLEKVS